VEQTSPSLLGDSLAIWDPFSREREEDHDEDPGTTVQIIEGLNEEVLKEQVGADLAVKDEC
jgi:hypothetical protein